MATKTKEEQVIYSEIESTIHVNDGEAEVFPDGTIHQPHRSKILLPGETLSLEEVPSYMVDTIRDNKAPGLVILNREEAERLNEFAKLVRGEAKISDFARKPEKFKEDKLDLDI